MAPTPVEALQAVAIAVTTVWGAAPALAAVRCERLGNPIAEVVPQALFQTTNARPRGGLLGSFVVEVEIYALAATSPDASALLVEACNALDPLAFANAGLDAVPTSGAAVTSDPLEPEEIPVAEAFGFATTLSLDVFIPPT